MFLPLLKTSNTQGPSSKLLQFLCLKFGVLPLLKTLNTQGTSSKFFQFSCLKFRVLSLLKTLKTQGPSSKFTQFLCLKFRVLHSFEDIEYTGSITQIHSIPMSPVWCSTSLKKLTTQGPSYKVIQFLCLQFGVLPL